MEILINVVKVTGLGFTQQGRFLLKNHQRLLIAGCFTGDGKDFAWIICTNKITAERLLQYGSNAEEADNRMWRNATQSPGSRALLYSPDTDVYNIGLQLVNQPSKNYILQLNVPYSSQKKYLNLNMAFSHDPDFTTLLNENLGTIML